MSVWCWRHWHTIVVFLQAFITGILEQESVFDVSSEMNIEFNTVHNVSKHSTGAGRILLDMYEGI